MNPELCKICGLFNNPDKCYLWTCKQFFERDAAKEVKIFFSKKSQKMIGIDLKIEKEKEKFQQQIYNKSKVLK